MPIQPPSSSKASSSEKPCQEQESPRKVCLKRCKIEWRQIIHKLIQNLVLDKEAPQILNQWEIALFIDKAWRV